ncbi:hypothetical protein [Escherichia coli]|nr:hypothetical protein [Escherichia coli]
MLRNRAKRLDYKIMR